MRRILTTLLFTGIALSGQAMAQDCSVEIEVNDTISFPIDELTIDTSCESYSVTLRHTGVMPAQSMGHNWVVTQTSDHMAVGTDAIAAGLDNNYVPPGDERVLVSTNVIGGGEETSVSFDPSILEPGGDYTFFCSFLGHFGAMKGTLIVN